MPTDPTRRIAGTRARAWGEALEVATLAHLTHQGAIVERLRTIVAVRGGRAVRRRVPGDLIGCTVDGKALLVECKAHQDGRRPVPSDYEAHQVEALRRWHRLGGVALTAWFDRHRQVVLVPAVEIVGVA